LGSPVGLATLVASFVWWRRPPRYATTVSG